MDQQCDLDGPGMELASSIDEGAFSHRLQHLAVTRMTLTEEEQRNRRSTWNVPMNDINAVNRPRKIIDKPPKINVAALRKLRSPEKKINTNQAHEDDADSLQSWQSITFTQIASPKRGGHEIDDPLPNLKTPEPTKPPPSLRLATQNSMAVHALAELGRRHSSLSTRELSIRTLSDSWSEGGVPRSSPLSTASNVDSPETTQNNPRNNYSYLLQLSHLMEGKPPRIIVEPPITKHAMEPMDGTDGSSLSSLDHRLPNKMYPVRTRGRRMFRQIVLIGLFFGSNVFFWCAFTQPELSMEILQLGAQKVKHYADRYYQHAERIVGNVIVNMNNQYGSFRLSDWVINETRTCLSPDTTSNASTLHSHLSYRPVSNEMTPPLPVQHRQQFPILEMEDAVMEETLSPHSDVVGVQERTHHLETQFWIDMMYPTQCFRLEEVCVRPGGWNHILLLSPIVVHRPLSEILGKSILDDGDDDIFQKPLMDIVGEFFRERRKQKELKRKEGKSSS